MGKGGDQQRGDSRAQGAKAGKGKPVTDSVTAIKQQLLNSVATGVGRQTGTWLKRLSDEAASPVRRKSGSEQARLQRQQTMEGWLEQLFDLFQLYGSEFNRINSDSNFVVTIERPTSSTKVELRYDGGRSTESYFTGRVTTRFLTLVISGHCDHVDCYMLPADKFFAFMHDPSPFGMYMRLLPEINDEVFAYRVNDDLIDFEHLSLLAKALFAGLITAATDGGKPALPESPLSAAAEREYPQPAKKRIEREKGAPAAGAAGQEKPAGSDDLPSFADVHSVEQFLERLLGPEHQRAHDLTASQGHGDSADSHEQGSPQGPGGTWQRASNPLVAEEPAANDGLPDFNWMCEIVLKVTEAELKQLVDYGAIAFSERKLRYIEPTFRLTSALSRFSEQVKVMLMEYKSGMSEGLKEELRSVEVEAED